MTAHEKSGAAISALRTDAISDDAIRQVFALWSRGQSLKALARREWNDRQGNRRFYSDTTLKHAMKRIKPVDVDAMMLGGIE